MSSPRGFRFYHPRGANGNAIGARPIEPGALYNASPARQNEGMAEFAGILGRIGRSSEFRVLAGYMNHPRNVA
ncbi:MAG TPA: hypothetical protein VMV69_12290 [Pirellulales bacterium]|nr:hypothetical protein [Pirellulales bacterium]